MTNKKGMRPLERTLSVLGMGVPLVLSLLILSGCTPTRAFRFNNAYDLEDARNIGAASTFVIVNCNVPGAAVRTISGEQVGTCPVSFEFVHDPTSAQTWGPPGMFDIGNSSSGYAVHFFGTVSASGYQPRDFRVTVNQGKAGAKSSQQVYVELFPHQAPALPSQPAAQQQQQQQQTVVIPDVGRKAPEKGTVLVSSTPGTTWLDTDGVHINAHGGGILFHDDAYYWFGQHMLKGEAGNQAMVGVRVYSSKDLYHWDNKGVALSVSDDPKSDIAKGCRLERPKVIYNAATKKFVMWFHLELKGQRYRAARSGVAVSDKVIGPYTFIESFRPDDAMARDQTLFVDDDGKAYHLYASENNNTLHISLLSDDYLTPSGKYVRVFENRYMEAPAICKRKGKYYFLASGCTGWKPNAARSAVAESIFGPWTELGNPCVGINPTNGLGPEQTFGGQSTFILPVQGKEDAFIAMFDIWRPMDAIDGRYIWLPIQFTDSGFKIEWIDQWDLSFFEMGLKHSGEQFPGGDSLNAAPQE